MSNPKLGTGKRFNDGKLRYDLVNPLAHEGMVDILTYGAVKRGYGDHNWEAGMPWSKVIQSLYRHVEAIQRGEDYDYYPDKCEGCRNGNCTDHSGKLHADHLQCNAHFLAAYYRIFPQGDDRYLIRRPKAKIGLDIDEVICDWVGGWMEHWGMELPDSWAFDYEIKEKMAILAKNNKLDRFYLSLKPKCNPADIPFEPHCYVTSRPVKTEVTKGWLEKMGFPLKPVITVGMGESKVDAIKATGLDIFVDDRYENYEELNRNGICCFLFDAPHNQRYNVGYRRIKSLNELKIHC